MKVMNRSFSMRIFTTVVISASLLLAVLVISDRHTEIAFKDLNERYRQIENLRGHVAHAQDNHLVNPGRLNILFNKQMEASLNQHSSQANFTRACLITILVFLLFSWLLIIRLAGRYQQDLVAANQQLSKRTRELDELNKTLDQKVQEKTASLQNAQYQLLQSEKFSAVGQLAAGIAHEINNPIGFINSNLQTLGKYVAHYNRLLGILNKLEKALKDKDQERAAQVVVSWEKIRTETNFAFIDDDIGNLLKESQEGAEKIRKIVLDLRAFASPDKGLLDTVDMEALIESMLNIVWNDIKYKAEVVKDYGKVPVIIGNPQKLSQVLVNLLINAAHAISDRGYITVKTYAKDGFVCVDITDTGCGIPQDHMDKIFNPFFTTKPVGQGTGLGLSISYDIIRKHGGTITFKSKMGQGSTFTVMLPEKIRDSALV